MLDALPPKIHLHHALKRIYANWSPNFRAELANRLSSLAQELRETGELCGYGYNFHPEAEAAS